MALARFLAILLVLTYGTFRLMLATKDPSTWQDLCVRVDN